MNIGELSKLSGVSSKMIRHYEEIGLIAKATRSTSGYRHYNQNDVHILRFVRRGRDFGFSIEEIKKLLGLWRNKKRSSAEVKKIADKHINEMEQKISELQSLVNTLKDLSHCCHGDERPECPILENLEAFNQ